VNPPYFPADRTAYYEVDDLFIKALVDVEIHLTVSRIAPLPNDSEEEDLIYRATLGLDSKMNLVGGRWEDPLHHPDFAWGSSKRQNEPELFGHFIKANVKIERSILKALIEQSASSMPQFKPIQISEVSSDPVMHGFSFLSKEHSIFGRISYLRYENPIEIYGHLAGKDKDSIVSIELIVPDEKNHGSSASSIAKLRLASGAITERRFFKIEAPGSIEDREGVRLRLYKREGSIDILLPTKKKFESSLDPDTGYK
jgi:hypothetical protein